MSLKASQHDQRLFGGYGSTEHGQAGDILGHVVSRAFEAVTGRPLRS